MQDWRLLALDMDGTVLTHENRISQVNQEWIRKAQSAGIVVTFATGRMFPGLVQKYAEEFGFQAPLVTLNGGVLWTAAGELVSKSPFVREDIAFLYEAACTFPLHVYAYTTNEGFAGEDVIQHIGEREWVKFVFTSTDSDLLHAASEYLLKCDRFEVTNTHAENIEVNPRGVNKANGLLRVCETLHIRPAQVIAMGDSSNDIAMLRFAGIGVAMGNATDKVAAAADFVSRHHQEDGVAYAIQAILEGRL